MNKAELIESLAKTTGQTKAESERWLSAFISTVSKNMKKKDGVKLVGFGTFGSAKEKQELVAIHRREIRLRFQQKQFQYSVQALP